MPFACPPCCRESSERHFLFPSIARKERAPKEQELLTAKVAKKIREGREGMRDINGAHGEGFFANFADLLCVLRG